MLRKILFSLIVVMVSFILNLIGPELFAQQKPMPKSTPQMFVWTSLAMGSSGHSASVALGEGIRKSTGVSVKVIPDATDLGGWLPILTGKAHASWRGTSASYAYGSGIGPVFGLPEWGPQRVRVIWHTPLIVGFATTKDTGIKTYADLKGKRIPDYRGWCSGRIELTAVLAAFNIKKDEVIWVPTVGYVDGMKALMEGNIDITSVSPEASIAYEIDAKRGIVWLEGPKDPEGIKRWLKNAPFFIPFWWDTGGPGTWWDTREGCFKKPSPETPIWFSGLRDIVLTHEKLDPDLAYLMTKGIWESYDFYQDMHPRAKRATHAEMLNYTVAMDPYHEGTIRYLKEIGKWTPEHERYQQGKLTLEAKRLTVWEEAVEEAKKKGMKFNDPQWYDEENGFCIQYLRDKSVISIPEIKYSAYKKPVMK